MAIASPTSHRLHYLDQLRLFGTFSIFLLHCCLPFTEGNDWHIMNREKSDFLTLVAWFLYQSSLPLLFFVSGAALRLDTSHRAPLRLIVARAQRLLVPFAVGMLYTAPLQGFFEMRSKGGAASFIQQTTTFYTHPDFSQELIGYETYQLWYLLFLFLYVLIILALQPLKFRRYNAHAALALLVPLVFTASIQASFKALWPDPEYWGDFLYWLTFMAAGYYFYGSRDWGLTSRKYPALVGAATTVTTLFMVVALADNPSIYDEMEVAPHFGLRFALYALVKAIEVWGFIYSITWLAARGRLPFHQQLERWSELALPFYLLHQPILVALAFFVVRYDLPLFVKFILCLAFSGFLAVVASCCVISGSSAVRFLFGLKPPPQQLHSGKRP